MTQKVLQQIKNDFEKNYSINELYTTAKNLMEYAKLTDNKKERENYITAYRLAIDTWKDRRLPKGMSSVQTEITHMLGHQMADEILAK